MTQKAKVTVETPSFPMFEMPKFDMPKFDMDAMEMPTAFREMAEKAVSQAKVAYDRAKLSAEEATEVLEDTFSATSKHANDLNKQMLTNAKTNMNATFDLAEKMFGVKTVAEAVEIQSEFARKQFETLTSQAKDLQSKSQKAMEACSKPAKDSAAKAMEQVKTVN
ncbi:phasin [Tepidamorphus sp. 3E244]|uniref:phasin n=1 Tax=Tepidamorphus sp. 3E244 TaxID=3385498 RepID=UPI0038FC8606